MTRLVVLVVLIIFAMCAGCGGAVRPSRLVAPTAARTLSNVYSGNGYISVGNITIRHDSVIHWTCRCPGFFLQSELGDDGKVISISSGKAGKSFVPAGTYRDVHTLMSGTWKFWITRL